jgi:hypothetical protein
LGGDIALDLGTKGARIEVVSHIKPRRVIHQALVHPDEVGGDPDRIRGPFEIDERGFEDVILVVPIAFSQDYRGSQSNIALKPHDRSA